LVHKRSVPVPRELVETLLGCQRAVLRRLEGEAGCKIVLEEGPDAAGGEDDAAAAEVGAASEEACALGEKALLEALKDPDALRLEVKKAGLLRSLAEGTAAAAAASAAAAAAGAAPAAAVPAAVTETFAVPNAMAGSIIGTGGENIKSVIMRTGAHVRVEAAALGQTERTVTVTGTAAAVAEARRLLNAQLEGAAAAAAAAAAAGGAGGGGGGAPPPGQASLQMQIPDERAGP